MTVTIGDVLTFRHGIIPAYAGSTVHSIADAYCGDWKSADEYAKEDARIEVANKWNRRAVIEES